MINYAVSVYNKRTHEHTIGTGFFENEVFAGYIIACNEAGVVFPDNDGREHFDFDEMVEEFTDYGYSIVVTQV